MWRRLLEREPIERRHLEDQVWLDRRRRDLENAIDPTVPRTLKGPDAPTESKRTAREITHLPPAPWCATCVLGRDIETPHVIIAMAFAVRKARAEDGGVDDDRETSLAIVDSSARCVHAIPAENKGATDDPASLVADFVKNLLVGRFGPRCDNETSIMAVAEKVKMKILYRVVLATTPRNSSDSNGLAERAARHESHRNQQSGNGWLDTLGFVLRETRVEWWHHTVQGSV